MLTASAKEDTFISTPQRGKTFANEEMTMAEGERFEVSAGVTPADLDAALAFVKKRARKRADATEGVSVALFAVMFATCEGLVDCGLSIENVDSMLDQFRRQVTGQIKLMQSAAASGMH